MIAGWKVRGQGWTGQFFFSNTKQWGSARQRRKYFLSSPWSKRDSAFLVLCSPSCCSPQSQHNHWSLCWVHYTIDFQNREIQVKSIWTQVPLRQFHRYFFPFLAFLFQPLSSPFAKQSVSHMWHVMFIHSTQYEGKIIGNMTFIKKEEEPNYYRNPNLKPLH